LFVGISGVVEARFSVGGSSSTRESFMGAEVGGGSCLCRREKSGDDIAYRAGSKGLRSCWGIAVIAVCGIASFMKLLKKSRCMDRSFGSKKD